MLKINQDILEVKFPNLYKQIKDIECNADVKFKNHTIYYKNIVLDNSQVKTIHLKPFDAILVYGFGAGNLIKHIIKSSNKCAVVCFEKNLCIIKEVLENNDISDILSYEKFAFVQVDKKSIETQVKLSLDMLMSRLIWGNLIEFTTEGYDKIESYPLKSLQETIRKFYMPIILNRNTLTQSSETIMENNIKNIPDISRGIFIDKLKDTYKNKPAIVVASGPSVSKNMHLLKEVKNKALIIAADSVIGTLLENNIYPDILCGVDYKKPNMEKYLNLLKTPHLNNIIYACESGVNFSIPKLFKHIIYNYQNNTIPSYFEKQIGKITQYRFGVNAVTHLAMMLAYILGINPLILIGQDWAYTEGLSHAAGISLESELPRNILWIKGNYQEKVPTDPNLLSGLKLSEDIISHFNKDNRIVINATEGGAFIYGTQIMSFKGAIEKYIRNGIINNNIIHFKNAPKHQEFLKTISNIKNEIKKLIYNASIGIKVNKEIGKKWKKSGNNKDIMKLVDKSNTLNDESTFSQALTTIVAQYYFKEFFSFYQEEMDIADQNTQKRISQSTKYFYLIKEKSLSLLEKFGELEKYFMLEKQLQEDYYSFINNLYNVLKLCEIYLSFDDIYRGIELTNQALKLHNDPILYYYRAKFKGLNIFLHEEALNDYKKAIEQGYKKAKFDYMVEKYKVESHLILAKKALERNDPVSAKQILSRVKFLEPKNTQINQWIEKVNAFATAKKSDAQQSLLFAQLKLDSEAYKIYNSAIENIKINKIDKAYEQLIQLEKNYGKFGDVTFLIGGLLLDKGNVDKAKEYIDKSINLVGFSPFIHLALGKLYLIKNDHALAREHLEKAIEIKNDLKSEILDTLGNLYFESQDYKKAIDAFNQFLPFSEDKKKTFTKIALCYKNLGFLQEYNLIMEKINTMFVK